MNHGSGTTSPKRCCVITGTSSGIGQALAVAALRKGWQVQGCARRTSSLSEAGYRHTQLDLNDVDAVRSWCTEVLAPWWRGASELALVNNAALLAPVVPGWQIDFSHAVALQKQFLVNTLVPWMLSSFALREAPEGARLTLVDVSSGAAKRALPSWGGYCASKAALLMGGQVLATDLEAAKERPEARTTVRILSYGPGLVDTEMQREIRSQDPQLFPALSRFQEMHRSGQLAPADAPAEQMLSWIEKDDLPLYSEVAR